MTSISDHHDSRFSGRTPRADKCPGVLRLFPAADGLLARPRVPGGVMDAAQTLLMGTLLRDGLVTAVDVTSRANVQLRGIREESRNDVTDTLWSHGLLPSGGHDRVLNILSDPFLGLESGDEHAVGNPIAELTEAITSEPELIGLPGKFLFGIAPSPDHWIVDACDVSYIPGRDHHTVVVPAVESSWDTSAGPNDLVRVAKDFLRLKRRLDDPAWRIFEMRNESAESLARLLPSTRQAPAANAMPLPPVLGIRESRSGGVYLHLGAPLARIGASGWEALAKTLALAGDEARLRLTPWRTVVVPGLSSSDAVVALRWLTDAGLLSSDDEPLAHIMTCAGEGECARSLTDVRGLARFLSTEDLPYDYLHLFGCDRTCGNPSFEHVTAYAVDTDAGARYAVSGEHLSPRTISVAELTRSMHADR